MDPTYNTYIGARYVPLVNGEWSSANTYEPLTIVTNQGNSYTSKTYVPAGVDINNTEYWVLTGNYNAQVEAYREEVMTFDNRITTNTNNIGSLSTTVQEIIAKSPYTQNSNILTVAKTGGMFTTINAAIDVAKGYCSVNNRVTIYIGPGTYNESIKLLPNPGIDFVGSGRDTCIVQLNEAYPESPLYSTGFGYYEGINFYSTGSSSYAYHFEAQTDATISYVTFNNCKFTAQYNAGVGIGMGNGSRLNFYNCEIDTTAANVGAVYAHNHPGPGNLNQYLTFAYCSITNHAGGKPVVIENAYKRAGGTGGGDVNQMYLSFLSCNARNPYIIYRPNTTDNLTYIPTSGDNILLLDNSVGSNMLGLDYYKSHPTLGGIYYANTGRLITIPYFEATRYNWEVTQALSDGGGDVKNSTSVFTGTAYVGISSTVEASANNAWNVIVVGTPK